jgi:hypothetical protein
LRGAGGVAIGLPLLDAMMPAKAKAQAAARPRRFLMWDENNGSLPSIWRPTGGGASFQLGALHASLEPYKKYLLFVAGLANKAGMASDSAGVHSMGMATIVTGGMLHNGGVWGTETQVKPLGTGISNPTSYSIDQRICAEPRYQGSLGAQFPSYQFGVQVSDIPSASARCSYKYTTQPTFITDTKSKKQIPQYAGTHVESNPQQVFKDLFGALPTGQPTTGGAGTPADQLLAAKRTAEKRKSVLDHVMGSFGSLMTKVGKDDQQRLTQHLELVRKLELDVAAIPANLAAPGTCVAPNGTTLPSGRPCQEFEQGTSAGVANTMGCTGDLFEPIGTAQMDLITAAFTCDLVRVGTMQWSQAGNRVGFGFLPGVPTGITHHDLAHANDVPSLQKIHTWYATMMAKMLGKLQAVVEPDGSNLLDNTGILWLNELTAGVSHAKDDSPFVLIGKAAGAFTPGRYLEFKGKGLGNEDLLVGILRAYGIMDARCGDATHPEYLTRPLTEIS